MPEDRSPEEVLKSLQTGRLAPVYLFYGPGEFRMEKVLDQFKSLVPEGMRDLNLEILYGGETEPDKILEHARSLPFLAERRMIIVRRTEAFAAEGLSRFLPYFQDPSPSTCLVFVASRTDFNKPFYKTLRSLGWAVRFEELKDQEAIRWIVKTASEKGFKIDPQAAAYLRDIVGNKTRELYGELEKLSLRFDGEVGIEQVKESVKHSRIYTVFELINQIASRNKGASLVVLDRFLEEEDKKDAPLRVIGMLNRQIRLLWRTKPLVAKGADPRDLMKELGTHYYGAMELLKQAKGWRAEELERAFDLLYQADGRIKSGSRPKPVLENLILSLCG